MTFNVLFWNLRGGTGKSTLALGLARALIKRQKTVAIVDMDPLMMNHFYEITVRSAIDLDLDINIIDCPPALTPEIEEMIKISNMVVIPEVCCSGVNVNLQEVLLKYCDPRRTFIVPKIRWQVPINQEDIGQVSEELADSILGLKV